MPSPANKILDELPSKEEITEQLLELEEDKRIPYLRKENARLRKLIDKKVTGADIAITAFMECYDSPLNIEVIRPPKSRKTKQVEEAVVHLTDLHFGKETDTYNSTVAAERIIRMQEAIHEITDLRRTHSKIDKLHLLMGGDFCEGEGAIFPNQEHEIDMDLIEQCLKFGPEVVGGLILGLLEIFPEIHICGVPGNHGKGRFTKGAKRNNSDSVMYEIIRLSIEKANPKAAQRIVWDLPFDRTKGQGWFAHGTIAERWNYMLVHGDQIRGQLGFPWYGAGKKVNGWNNNHDVPPFDFLFMGHFHTQANFDLNRISVISTGSPEDSNAYAAESLAASGAPKQRVLYFNESRGLLSDNPIYLEE